MKKYNVGIIGYGWAATAHIEAINKTTQGQVTAIYSSRKLDDAELSAKHGGNRLGATQHGIKQLAPPTGAIDDIGADGGSVGFAPIIKRL